MFLTKVLVTMSCAVWCAVGLSATSFASTPQHWVKIKATDKYQRSAIANKGISIEVIEDDYVVVMASDAELQMLKKEFNVLVHFPDRPEASVKDFPKQDAEFHNYAEMTDALKKLASENPGLVALSSAGKSLEGRELWVVAIGAAAQSATAPGILILGGHHAREHLSIEVPLRFAQRLVEEYKAGNARVRSLLNQRSVYILPEVNPDGSEYDIAGNGYRSWRKNRSSNKDGTSGVDLNRNYDFKWGTAGISHNPSSDVFCGPAPFSEPETQAVKKFIDTFTNINIVLSLHTFSKLILYPWGHTYDPISDDKALRVHSTMAKKMSEWNGYTPQQASDLYLVSGDTGDWSYGTKGLVTFTFELDPKSIFEGGFYPGQKMIAPVLQKNWEPFLYLIDYSNNPYRVLDSVHQTYGLQTPIVR
jgi:carboxypeptidase T